MCPFCGGRGAQQTAPVGPCSAGGTAMDMHGATCARSGPARVCVAGGGCGACRAGGQAWIRCGYGAAVARGFMLHYEALLVLAMRGGSSYRAVHRHVGRQGLRIPARKSAAGTPAGRSAPSLVPPPYQPATDKLKSLLACRDRCCAHRCGAGRASSLFRRKEPLGPVRLGSGCLRSTAPRSSLTRVGRLPAFRRLPTPAAVTGNRTRIATAATR